MIAYKHGKSIGLADEVRINCKPYTVSSIRYLENEIRTLREQVIANKLVIAELKKYVKT